MVAEDEIIQKYMKMLEEDPDDINTRHYLIEYYLKKDMLDEAIEEAHRAIGINSDYAPVHNSLGLAYEKKNLLDEAISEFKEAVSVNPNYARAYNNLGMLYLRKDMIEEAMSVFEKALSINPLYGNAFNNIAIAHCKLAMRNADRAIELGAKLDPELKSLLAKYQDKT